jgi:NAD(P) transhydrogenase
LTIPHPASRRARIKGIGVSEAYDYDLVCIGSGPAGQRAAVQAAKLGKRAAVLERERVVGGVCLHTGTIPSKTFREAVIGLTNRANPFDPRNGEGARNRPSAQALFSRVADIIEREVQVQEDQLRRNDVDVISGTAEFDDAHSIVVHSNDGDRTISADNILVAVGTKPAPVSDLSVEHPAVITSDEILQLTELPRSMVVIGCGVVGIEYASMFASLGVEVTIVDGRKRPLEFLDEEIVDELIHQMRAKRVVFRLSESVERLEIMEDGLRRVVVHLNSGKRMASDMALVCAGRTGATAALKLASAGLEADERGRLAVDENFRTNTPNIFAAGDVIGYPSLAATSSEQGRLAACKAFGASAGTMPAHFPIGVYSIPEISMVGAPEHELTRDNVPYEVGVARFREIARGQILGDDTGFMKMMFHREDRRLLGAHIIGTGATELIHIGQCVIGLGGGLDYFMETVFNYPTLAECYKVAALDAHNRLQL